MINGKKDIKDEEFEEILKIDLFGKVFVEF